FCKERSLRNGQAGRIVIRGSAPTNLTIRGNTLRECIVEEEPISVVRVIGVCRQSAEIVRAKQLMPSVDEGAKKSLALKAKPVVRVGEPFEPIAFVVPIVDGENARAVGDKMFAFGAKRIGRKLAEAAHIRPAEKARRGLKTFG